MQSSYWGYWLVVMGVAIVGLMISVQGITTNTTQDSYAIREIAEASMLDAVDYAYYRDYNEVKIDKEKFMEVFIRRVAETMGANDTYEVNFYAIYEAPPKVSVEIKSNSGANFVSANGYDTISRVDAIIQIHAENYNKD
ncbi:unknown [Mycoplasma sp. CAG:776]|nr:unknown [Mycoplasma sp. CAG:776]